MYGCDACELVMLGRITTSCSGRGTQRRAAELGALLRHEVASFTVGRSQEAVIQPWCGVACSRTGGASLATAGYQALGKRRKSEWHTGPIREMVGRDKVAEASMVRIVTRAELEPPFGSRAKTAWWAGR